MKDMPKRWAYKHGAYYYRPRDAEREAWDDKAWYRLGATYAEALREYATRHEIQLTDKLGSVMDRYEVEKLPMLSHSAQQSYRQSLGRLRHALAHNPVGLITPKAVYQYLDAMAKAKGMGVANQDLKVLNQVMNAAVRWGVVDRQPIKGAVSYYGKRDGLKKERDRYVEDWELAEWQKVASRQQRAFAALVLLTGVRKSDCLRIMEAHISDDTLSVQVSKSGRPLAFVLTQALRDAISEARACKPKASLYLLPNRRGGCYVNDKAESKSWDGSWTLTMRKAIKQTELEESFTMHDLRAKVGSDADSEQRAQELLDHTSPSITRAHYRRKRRAIRPVK